MCGLLVRSIDDTSSRRWFGATHSVLNLPQSHTQIGRLRTRQCRLVLRHQVHPELYGHNIEMID